MGKEEMWKNAILIIAICFIIVLTLIDVSLFSIVKIQALKINELTNQSRQQQVGVDSFIFKLQQCKTINDLDMVLKSINVERLK